MAPEETTHTGVAAPDDLGDLGARAREHLRGGRARGLDDQLEPSLMTSGRLIGSASRRR